MGKGTKKVILLTTACAASIYAYNRFVEKTATSKGLLSDANGSYFNWKHGDVFYTKRGNGKPLLLLHDLAPESSSFEWAKVMKRLEKNHTVYTVDLLGCGRSDKPAMQYTNFLYVQLITAFVKEVINDTCDVLATNLSTSFVITANNMDETLFDQIILVNPISLNELSQVTDTKAKIKNYLLATPFIGTFFYNVMMNPKQIDRTFRNLYFRRPELISSNMEDVYYEAAHTANSSGRYLFGSILGRFMNFDIRHALSKTDKTIYIIGSRDKKGNVAAIEEYKRINSKVEITYISGSELLPQMEIPEKFITVVKPILSPKEN